MGRLMGGVQPEAEQHGEGDYQAGYQSDHKRDYQADGRQQNQENSHESKQKEEKPRQRTYLQHESSFFRKLCPELRYLIYCAVLLPPEGTELRIARTRGRLCSYTYSRDMDELNSVPSNDGEELEEDSQEDENRKPNRSAGLLCSCRQVYAYFPFVLYIYRN